MHGSNVFIVLLHSLCVQVIAYVTAAKRLSENELYDISLQREPSS